MNAERHCPMCNRGPSAYKMFRLGHEEVHRCIVCGYQDYESVVSPSSSSHQELHAAGPFSEESRDNEKCTESASANGASLLTPSPPTAYELMVKRLLDTELRIAGLTACDSFHLKKYTGKSGQQYEIDVSFEIKVGNVGLLFIVECKNLRRRVGVAEVTKLAYKIGDIGAHKGLLVSPSGFESGAVKVAKSEGIALLVAVKGRVTRVWACLGDDEPSHQRGERDETDWIQLGIASLSIATSSDGSQLRLSGRRSAGYRCCVDVLRISNETQFRTGEDLYFLLAEEEPVFQQTRHIENSPFCVSTTASGWGRLLPRSDATQEDVLG